MGDDATVHAGRILHALEHHHRLQGLHHHPGDAAPASGSPPVSDNKQRLLLTTRELLLSAGGNSIHRNKSSPSCDERFTLASRRAELSSLPAYSPASVGVGGTELVKKKSYHPELMLLGPADAADGEEEEEVEEDKNKKKKRNMDIRVLQDSSGMELIHLNRTCTSINLMASAAASASSSSSASPRPRVRMSSSDARLSDEERMYKVRHQVSYAACAHTVSGAEGVRRGRPPFGSEDCEDLLHALKRSSALTEAAVPDEETTLDEDIDPFLLDGVDDYLDYEDVEIDEEQDSFDFSSSAKISPEGDLDYLEVRPSLASTQLNELRGPS